MTDIGGTKAMSTKPTGGPILDSEIVRAATEVANNQLASFAKKLSLDFQAAVKQASEDDRPYKKVPGSGE